MAEQKVKIVIMRVELYRDFTINLLHKIYDYYLDSKTLNDKNDKYNHYNWCYNEVCKSFAKENMMFADNDDLRTYFYSFYELHIYNSNTCTDKSSIDINKLDKFWRSIFNYKFNKVGYDMNLLVEVYVKFDKSLVLKKKLLEKV